MLIYLVPLGLTTSLYSYSHWSQVPGFPESLELTLVIQIQEDWGRVAWEVNRHSEHWNKSEWATTQEQGM